MYYNTHTHITKEWNIAIYNNVDGHQGHYGKWKKSDKERQNAIWSFWYVESKKQKQPKKKKSS